jgi:hypothetical protein
MDCAAIARIAGALEQNQSNSAHGAMVQGASFFKERGTQRTSFWVNLLGFCCSQEQIMAAFTYPGVYIEKISSGQHSITGVATSIAAFIGYTNVGPVDEAVMVESWTEFESLFGSMIPGVYLGYAVYQFFQNGGTQPYIVRLCDQLVGHAATAIASIGGLTIYANNPGSRDNNIAVAITGINTVNSTFNLQVYKLTGSGSLSMLESYINLSIYPSNASYAVTIVNDDSNYIAFAPIVLPSPPPTLTLPSSSAAYEGVYTVNGTFTGTITQNDALKQSGGAQGDGSGGANSGHRDHPGHADDRTDQKWQHRYHEPDRYVERHHQFRQFCAERSADADADGADLRRHYGRAVHAGRNGAFRLRLKHSASKDSPSTSGPHIKTAL